MKKVPDLIIRDAQESEHGTIRDITLVAYEEFAAVLPAPLWEGYRRQVLVSLDGDGPVERIVAEWNGTIVGSVLLYPATANVYGKTTTSVGRPEVRLLAVLPAARGQGVGAALMAECVQRARRAGATVLGLHTTDIMQTAMRMYERMGFVRAPELDFRPVEAFHVKGYLLSLNNEARGAH